jgi:hypothetical protein
MVKDGGTFGTFGSRDNSIMLAEEGASERVFEMLMNLTERYDGVGFNIGDILYSVRVVKE